MHREVMRLKYKKVQNYQPTYGIADAYSKSDNSPVLNNNYRKPKVF